MSKDLDLAVLILHKENLSNAKIFEEYKAAHVSYVEYLIGLLMSL